jgi:hypothetical protein
MSANTPSTPLVVAPDDDGGQTWIYWVVGAVVVILVVVGLITYSGAKETKQAQDKAGQLTQKFEQAGLRVPQDQSILTRSLGSDGGAVCENPASSLGKAILFDQLTNGASFVGQRPVIVDRNVVKGQLLILETYCPEKLQQFRNKIDEKLKFDNVLKG